MATLASLHEQARLHRTAVPLQARPPVGAPVGAPAGGAAAMPPDAYGALLAPAFAFFRAPVVGVDAAARIGFANPPAAGLLAQDDALFAARGRLEGRGSAPTRRLHAAVRRASCPDGGAPQALALPREAGPDLRVMVLPLGRGLSELSFALVVAAADAHGTGRAPSAALLAALLGVTSAEASVALLVARGDGLPAVAAALGIARSTARTHLRRVFEKAGVRRQAELAWLIAHLPA